MATAKLTAAEGPDESQRHPRTPARKRKPPIALRPLHRMWRRTIDDVEVVRVELPVRRLPTALAGLVACQISDFHVDRDEDLNRLEQAVRTINRQQPDLVFLTGDYFSGPDTMRRYLGGFQRALAELKPKSGVFAIAGNHDHWSSFGMIAEALRSSGARVMANENAAIEVRGERLTIVGIDDLWSRRAEPSRAFRDVGPRDCTIVLAHNPDTALYASHLAPGVMLSGHTHGGVVRIPYYGSPINSILRIGKEFYAGLNRYGDFYIYTNRGLGTFWMRIRINCRPEISRFELMPLADSAKSQPPPKARKARRPRRRYA
ncbi:MAG TPA: metallophosphoesterase [Candidatus Binataceae bacterium]|nr:metallophosphoesterase [Candidatus Binataceae bacterium]